jgi:two-component system, OmpR family, sensor histidine kinase CpxA
MRSLFLKIFLSFWIAGVLVSLGAVITWNLQPEVVVRRWRTAMGEAASLYAQGAAAEFEERGLQGVTNYLQRLDTSAYIHAALLDENGTLIAGTAPRAAVGLMKLAGESGQPEFSVRNDRAYAAIRIVGPSGRAYMFAASMPRGPMGALGIGMRALRWVVSILVSGLICYLLTLYLTRPVLRLRTASHQIAGGNLSARAAPVMEKRRDEIGELVRDFNQMAERIESLVNSQRQLISDISHELRSPLARLNVALGLARQRAGSSAAAPLDRIEREAERLNEMIGKLLALARMQAAAGLPEKTRMKLDELLRDIAADAEFEAQARDSAVRMINAGEGCEVIGSPELLRSALENVVRNAIRYTEGGTDVEISVGAADDQAVITVRDHGPGVPESEMPNLFRPFYRVAGARERETGGTGLGLAITYRAVNLHGGNVRAANAEGGGLAVEVRLPLAPPVAASAVAPAPAG